MRKSFLLRRQNRTYKVTKVIALAPVPALLSSLVGFIRRNKGFAGKGGRSTERLCGAVLDVLSFEEEVCRGTEGQPAPSQILTVMHSHLNLTAPAHFKQR